MGQPGSIIAGFVITAMLPAGSSWITTGMVVGVAGVILSGVAMLGCKPVPELAAFGSSSQKVPAGD
jgi:putative MFS transporter